MISGLTSDRTLVTAALRSAHSPSRLDMLPAPAEDLTRARVQPAYRDRGPRGARILHFLFVTEP